MRNLYQNVWVGLSNKNGDNNQHDGRYIEAAETSDEIHSFLWRQRDGYENGQLLLRFESSSGTRRRGIYSYDVPRGAFDELLKRALHPEQASLSPFAWYKDNLVNYVAKEDKGGSLHTKVHILKPN